MPINRQIAIQKRNAVLPIAVTLGVSFQYAGNLRNNAETYGNLLNRAETYRNLRKLWKFHKKLTETSRKLPETIGTQISQETSEVSRKLRKLPEVRKLTET